VHLGVVGPRFWREAAAAAFDPLEVRVVAEADEGFEQVTLNAVREYALAHDGAVLYAHTKGAADASQFRAQWRRSMTRRVVGEWERNLDFLGEVDAVGCHWLTLDAFPWAAEEFRENIPFFGGNFWLARCEYLRTLPHPSTRSRFDAERWIGLGHPRVHDLLPGWPDASLFA